MKPTVDSSDDIGTQSQINDLGTCVWDVSVFTALPRQ